MRESGASGQEQDEPDELWGRIVQAVLDLVVVGWIVALVPAIWAFVDLGRIPRRIWYWTGYHREPWRTGLVIAWVLGGWGAIVVAIAWRRSAARTVLLDEFGEVRARHRRRQTA
jgi:hypothetical protein